MIKINLLVNRLGSQAVQAGSVAGGTVLSAAAEATGVYTTSIEVVEPINLGDIMLKLIWLVVFIAILVGYEMFTINQKSEELGRLKSELGRLESELSTMRPQVETAQRFQKEKQRLEKQLQVVKDLSKERLMAVRSLDALQSLIPEKVWLEKAVFKEKEVKLDGRAVDELGVSAFMQGLEESAFFSDVYLLQSQEAKGEEGAVRSFKVQSKLETP